MYLIKRQISPQNYILLLCYLTFLFRSQKNLVLNIVRQYRLQPVEIITSQYTLYCEVVISTAPIILRRVFSIHSMSRTLLKSSVIFWHLWELSLQSNEYIVCEFNYIFKDFFYYKVGSTAFPTFCIQIMPSSNTFLLFFILIKNQLNVIQEVSL